MGRECRILPHADKAAQGGGKKRNRHLERLYSCEMTIAGEHAAFLGDSLTTPDINHPLKDLRLGHVSLHDDAVSEIASGGLQPNSSLRIIRFL